MQNSSEPNNGISLQMFRLLFDSKYEKLTDNDYIKKQNNLLKISGINKDLNNKRAKEIRIKCKFLGENGWVISPYWIPDANETWYDTWFWLAFDGSCDKITDYFLRDDYALLKNINRYSFFEVDRCDWFKESEILFEQKHFTACAMLLTAILEQSIRKCPIIKWHRRISITEYYNQAIKNKVEDYYNNYSIEPLCRYIETILILPSIDSFISDYFNSGNHFDDGEEPDFLERNWLMHGLTKRTVTESDCIKLYNVICSLTYIMQTLFKMSNDNITPQPRNIS